MHQTADSRTLGAMHTAPQAPPARRHLIPVLAPATLALLALLALAPDPALAKTTRVEATAKPAPPAAPTATEAEAARSYQACLTAVRTNANKALSQAEAWVRAGGGAPADHCAGLALVELGRLSQAAARLEAASSHAKRPDLGADLLDQAGNVWLMEGSFNKAYEAFTRSLALRPNQPQVMVDRARALGAQDDWEGVAAELGKVLKLAPGNVDAHTLRAGARRRLGDLGGARADVEAALGAMPGDPDALLERGAIRHLAGDDPGARTDWADVLKKAPESPAAEAARANIEALGLKPEADAPAP